MRKYTICFLVIMLLLQGCAGEGKTDKELTDTDNTEKVLNEDSNDTEEDKLEPTAVPTIEPTPTPEPTPMPEPTPTPKPELILPLATNDSGKVRIQTVSADAAHLYSTYIISSINGENVVLDPNTMPPKSKVDIDPVAILSTHSHSDHVDKGFTESYDCEVLLYDKGEIHTDDFNIYTVLSWHKGDEPEKSLKNYIVVLEVDGIRIAHMGDIGQTSLTEEQLDEIGEIDIAFMQFENSYSAMSLKDEKGFKLIEQLNPKIVIPTHYSKKSLPVLEEKYGAITEVDNILEITVEELPETSMNVYRILNSHRYI